MIWLTVRCGIVTERNELADLVGEDFAKAHGAALWGFSVVTSSNGLGAVCETMFVLLFRLHT